MLRHRKQTGLTLVELMIALVLGLMVSGAVLGIYVNSSRNFAQDERYARMQENARYALRVLSEDIVMADFWGQVIATDTVTTTLTLAASDCGVPVAALSADAGLHFNNYHSSPASTQFTPCTAISANHKSGTDILSIKRVSGVPTARTFVDVMDTDSDGDTSEILTSGASNLQANVIYLRSNGTNGALIDDATSANPPALGESDWQYLPRIYFIRDHYESAGDGIPALCRLDLDEDALDELSCVAEGIEDLHVQWGIDSNGDAVPNFYTASPTLTEMEGAITARIFLLARTSDATPHFTDTKSYRLGDVTIAASNDGFMRSVFTTTLSLRNPTYRSILD